MRKALVILGPTSTGKTDLALRLASKFQGELVSVDSRQVYQGLDIGSGKLPGSGKWLALRSEEVRRGNKKWEVGGINIWMYDVVDPKKQYTVYNYVQDANKVIEDILKRGKLPIIVGGTGLYLKALLEGLPNLAIPMDPKLREELEKLPLEELQKRLQVLSPDKWEKMNNSDRQNSRRLIRAIELVTLSLRGVKRRGNLQRTGKIATLIARDDNVLKIGLITPRDILYKRINERVVSRINQGMVDEAKELHKNGLTLKRMRQLGLEYGVLADYLEGKITDRENLVKVMQGKIHGFARRQITWFKNPSTLRLRSGRASSGYIQWFDITDPTWLSQVESKVNSWYYTFDDQKD